MHIRPYKNSAGQLRHQARWIDPAGKERAKGGFKLKKDAQAHLDTVTADTLTGKYADPRAGKVTVKVYAEQWAAAQPWAPSTRNRVTSTLNKHIYPVFGDRPIASITRTEIQGWTTRLGDTLVASSARGVFSVLTGVFSAALADRVIGVNPCDSVDSPAKVRVEVTIPTPAEVQALVDAAPSWFKAAVLLAAGAGMRQSEVSGLALDRVTFPVGTPIFGSQRGSQTAVRVDRQLAVLTGQPTYLKAPKTSAGTRTLPMSSAVTAALIEHVRNHLPLPVTLPWSKPGGKPVTVGLLFHRDGKPIDRTLWSQTWRQIQADTGITVGFHDLRHYAVSGMIRRGCSPKEVQHFAGHADSKMTFDVYGHLWSDSEDRIRAALESLDFGQADQQKGQAL